MSDDQPILAMLELTFEVPGIGAGETVRIPMTWTLNPRDLALLGGRREVAARRLVLPAGGAWQVEEVRVAGHVVAAMFKPSGKGKFRAAELVTGKGYERLRRGVSDGEHFRPTDDGPHIGRVELTVTNRLVLPATLQGVVLAG